MRTGKVNKYKGRVISAWQYMLNTGRYKRILTVSYDEATGRLQNLVISEEKVIVYDKREEKYFLIFLRDYLQRFPLQEIRLNHNSGKLTWLREAPAANTQQSPNKLALNPYGNESPTWEKCSCDEPLISFIDHGGWLLLGILLTSFVVAFSYVSHAQIVLAILPVLFACAMFVEIEDKQHESLLDKLECLFGAYTIEKSHPSRQSLSSSTKRTQSDRWLNELNALCKEVKKQHPNATDIQAQVSLIDNWEPNAKPIFTTSTSNFVDHKTGNTRVNLPPSQVSSERTLVSNFVEKQYGEVSHSDGFPLVELILVITDPSLASGGYIWYATAAAQVWGGGAVPNITTYDPRPFKDKH